MTVMIWVTGLVEMSRFRNRIYENVVVRPDGEPAVQSYASGS